MNTTTIGPKGLPITGNLLAFRKDPLAFLLQTAQKYGDIAHLRFGTKRNLYFINNPDWIKEVLVTKQASFHKAKGLQIAKTVVGEGILTSEGEKHLRQRRLMQPMFHKKRIVTYAEQMVRQAESFIAQWKDGEQRHITKDMMALTLDIITETMFGTTVREQAVEIGRAIEVGLHYVSRRSSSILDIPLTVPTKSNREFLHAAQFLDRTIYSIIEQRRSAAEGAQRHDLLSMLMEAQDEEDGSQMSDRQIRDEVMTIFLAGHETTANTMSWIWYLLATHPEVEEKFLAELKTVLGGRAPTADDIEHLPYTNLIITEALRLYPPAWVINREVIEPVTIGTQPLQPGDTVMMSQYVMHRNPRYFTEPERFLPERFAGNLLKEIPAYAYFPFGGGPRICIGNNFALMEAALLLATIGQRYQLRLAHPDQSVEPEPLVTLRPKNLHMIVTSRC